MPKLILTLVVALAAVSFPIYLVIWLIRLLLLTICLPVFWFGLMVYRKLSDWKGRKERKLLASKGR